MEKNYPFILYRVSCILLGFYLGPPFSCLLFCLLFKDIKGVFPMIYDNFAFDCLLSVFNIKNFQQEVLKVGKPLRQSQIFLFFYILTCILNIIKQKQQSSMPKYINFSFLHQCQHLLSGKFQRYCLYLAVSSLSSSISQFWRMT